jgi:hypothetical protein
LIRQAAQGGVQHNDDTGMRILRLTREPGDKRTGTFTSGIVSMVGWEGWSNNWECRCPPRPMRAVFRRPII